jgi:N-acyl-D-aspartate/D-glutamate deacylase
MTSAIMRTHSFNAAALLSLSLSLSLSTLAMTARPAEAQRTGPLDVVIVGGRVLDPETNLDAVRTIGIRNGRIALITSGAGPAARDTVNARGLVVAPGFIELHSHGQDSTNYEYLARDGVTTALELELGTYPVAPWYAARQGHALINFGTAASHPGARRAMLDHDSSAAGDAVISHDGAFVRQVIEPARLPDLERRLDAALREGGLGIGMGINYTPAATREEIFHAFQVAARHHVPVFVHLRSSGLMEAAGGVAGVQEVLADAAATGAPLHVVHVTSMGLGATPTLLALIDGARARGMDVTTEAYPYIAGATYLQSAMFDSGFQSRLGISYNDILWPATGERLTAESFERYRKSGGLAVIFMIPESAADQAYRDPHVMVASDGGFTIVNGKPVGHPRSAGTHARVLGRYARDRKVISLMDAVRKMTILPARRLEGVDANMKHKGRLQVGADADITIFDAARVIDRATFEDPLQYSAGIVDVFVNGTRVVRDEKLVRGVSPGRAVRGPVVP